MVLFHSWDKIGKRGGGHCVDHIGFNMATLYFTFNSCYSSSSLGLFHFNHHVTQFQFHCSKKGDPTVSNTFKSIEFKVAI